VFHALTIHGGAGAVLWGSRVAVELTAWRIVRTPAAEGGQWILTATIGRVDHFQARQTPLLFTAPRAGGFWAWPIAALDLGETNLRASLGPPER
jgi:hypothetical protein